MAESRFLYVTYIRATPERIWEHLTTPELNRLFWGGYFQKSRWQVGADYLIEAPDGQVWDQGKVIVSEPPRRLQVTWLHLRDAAMKAEGESTVAIELEPAQEGVTKLTLTHAIDRSPSKLIDAVSGGWPSILASLKSLLETGQAL